MLCCPYKCYNVCIFICYCTIHCVYTLQYVGLVDSYDGDEANKQTQCVWTWFTMLYLALLTHTHTHVQSQIQYRVMCLRGNMVCWSCALGCLCCCRTTGDFPRPCVLPLHADRPFPLDTLRRTLDALRSTLFRAHLLPRLPLCHVLTE